MILRAQTPVADQEEERDDKRRGPHCHCYGGFVEDQSRPDEPDEYREINDVHTGAVYDAVEAAEYNSRDSETKEYPKITKAPVKVRELRSIE